MIEEANNKFNANARLFSKDQAKKILQELDIELEPSQKKTPKSTVQPAKQETPTRLPQGDVEDILRQNFIQDELNQA
jgi:hypothetical protein